MSANTSHKGPKAGGKDAASTAAEAGVGPHRANDRPNGQVDGSAAGPQFDAGEGADVDPSQQGSDPTQEPDPAGGQIAALEAKLSHSEMRLSATLSQYKDALDEFANVKARLRRDIGKEIAAGKRSILTDLLDVVDNLERAIEAAKNAGEADDAFFTGVCMVRDQFLQKLEAQGVRRRQAEGQPFDPDHFEAISTVPVASAEQDGLVLGVVRDCYMLGEETLRHGMVAVGKYKAS